MRRRQATPVGDTGDGCGRSVHLLDCDACRSLRLGCNGSKLGARPILVRPRFLTSMSRRTTRALISYVLLGALSCTDSADQRSPSGLAYRVREAPLPVSLRDSILGGAPFWEIARALDIPDLREVTLPSSVQELRLSNWYPSVYGWPVVFLRIIRQPDQTYAELYVWSGVSRDSTAVTDAAQHSYCGPVSDRRRVCVESVTFDAVANWDSLAMELETLGPCELPGEGHVDDGGELLLQMLDGETYRSYECNAPKLRRSESARRAAAAMELLQQLVQSTRTR